MNKKERIFDAAHDILAEQGFHGLSIAMVAKQAKVATGTIYRYFSDKEDLIRQLYRHTIMGCREQILNDVNIEETSFEQYRQLWLNIHHIFTSDPNAIICKLQYECSPLASELERDPVIMALWEPLDRFFERGRITGLFIDLPLRVLQSLSLDSVALLLQQCRGHKLTLTDTQQEAVIRASWQAILQP
ncbi:TetR/AcrR family transcriptional regulator [Aeromonas rivuli]|jgi:TetR/AcrR family transcriptional regulator, multidrug resistance operon repressor|uniref:TetR/AcrR family transcriptional regulator n=1 Tax=Aeromonas TaxID=642 RepID=UPI0005A863D1|nr:MULTISPECIES: TetR/AcrR family transcriptional regulator [Aeromonas]MCS3456970.1 TetR/AcrR family transcriptional repressor of multidrug resistance operon [Aeromonas sp. BIGb0405]MCS3461180.1 TetR/AcrR family transcriptional repressor of multidrug resistance operon [Aeromonas sp. BIGb0445]UBO74086.1 TetR/AcrR family transcriptional regulator [Aeromonas rivuli]